MSNNTPEGKRSVLRDVFVATISAILASCISVGWHIYFGWEFASLRDKRSKDVRRSGLLGTNPLIAPFSRKKGAFKAPKRPFLGLNS